MQAKRNNTAMIFCKRCIAPTFHNLDGCCVCQVVEKEAVDSLRGSIIIEIGSFYVGRGFVRNTSYGVQPLGTVYRKAGNDNE